MGQVSASSTVLIDAEPENWARWRPAMSGAWVQPARVEVGRRRLPEPASWSA
jgi:hypothetical protein